MPQDRVLIVGVAAEGISSLSPPICQRINQAEFLFGGKRLLEMFPAFAGEKMTIGNNLTEVAGLIKLNLGQKRIVVLASGDPGFYGITRYLSETLGKGSLEIIPNVSSMQLAFARIGESWGDAALTSVHSRPIEEIVDIVRSNRKVGILTDDRNTPAEIARVLSDYGVGGYRSYVCQDLGTENEKITESDLGSLKNQTGFSSLNIVILIKNADREERDISTRQLLGLADDRFKQPTQGHLITKLEVRAVSLAKLALTEKSTVWDIGAGSGAVAIEAAFLARKGNVFAIEKNAEAVDAINENVRRFGCDNISVIQAMAPDKLDSLPAPDAVFVGGNGGEMDEILLFCCRRLKPGGRLVVNAATLETLQDALDGLKVNGFASEVTFITAGRSKAILNLTRLEALNPVFVITGWREEKI